MPICYSKLRNITARELAPALSRDGCLSDSRETGKMDWQRFKTAKDFKITKYETDEFMAIVDSGILTERATISSAINKISKHHKI